MPSRRERRSHRRSKRILGVGVALVVLVGLVSVVVVRSSPGESRRVAPLPATTVPAAPVTTTPPPTAPPFVGWVNPASAFGAFPDATTPGLLTFRGNPTRTFHGLGPVPGAPRVLWRTPAQKMCSLSKEFEEETTWCGTGWTG